MYLAAECMHDLKRREAPEARNQKPENREPFGLFARKRQKQWRRFMARVLTMYIPKINTMYYYHYYSSVHKIQISP